MGLTYKDAGVDIDAGEKLVERIRPLAASTKTPQVLAGIGGFAGLCALPQGMEDPVLVAGTDGVGTKLKLAFAVGKHDTVGIDLVAMCVNDIVTVGAKPLFFLDYFATGKLEVDQAAQVVEGIAAGCRDAGCALLGGETAELPGFYAGGEYDLAGFAVGVVDRKKSLDGSATCEGDVLLGLESSGLHSNGFSLARRVLLERAELSLNESVEGLEHALGQELLVPTRIYVRAALAALEIGGVHGMCHVTGGGLTENLPRVLPGLSATIQLGAWETPPIFDLIQRLGDISDSEMRRTFNMGIGFVLVVAPEKADAISEVLRDSGQKVHRIGEVVALNADARVSYEA